MKKLLSSLVITTVLLVGCASTPISTKDALLISDDQVLIDGRKYISQDKNSGQIIIKRDGGFSGSACSTRIYINAKAVADLDASQKILFTVPVGEYVVSAEPNGLCGGGLTEVKVSVKLGSKSVFRYGTSGWGSPAIYPTAF